MRRSIRKRLFLGYASLVSLLLWAVCKLELGDAPIGPDVNSHFDPNDTVYTLTINTSKAALRSDGKDSAVIIARIVNGNGFPLIGDTISLSYKGSSVNASLKLLTDSSGRVGAYFRSTRYNDSCVVKATSAKTGRSDSLLLLFTGTRLLLEFNAEHARVNDYVSLTANLLDASNTPISGDSIVFSTRTGLFSNNATSYATALDASGQATARVTARTAGSILITTALPGKNINDSISFTFDTTSTLITEARQFHLYSSRSQLKADNTDTATITAVLINEKNNPAVGDTIDFEASKGIIGAMAIIDSSGRGRVTLRSRPENGVSRIKATSRKNKTDTATTEVIFSGVKVRLEADVNDLKINEYASITARLADASGNPIGGNQAIFTSTGGVFTNNSSLYTAVLDPIGNATVKVTSRSAGTIRVYATAANTEDSIAIIFTNNVLSLTASKTMLTVGGNDAAVLTATYLDGSNAPVPDVPITFSANAGTITVATVNTNTSGQAQTTIKSANFATIATIVASATAGNALIKISFVSALPKKIKLTLSPDNIGINGGVSSLTATVTDTNDNMVTGADVNFRILKGPGGGEYIDKPVATSQNGIAHAQLFAGSVPSMYRACLVSATVGTLSDTTKLTISGEPYAISVSRPQSDTVVVPKAGQMDETTFDYNVGAVVVDINGNPVADGTRVNFSTVVSGMAVHKKYFIKWKGLGGTADEIAAVCAYGTTDIPFEDINNNFRMDENDLRLDYNDAVASRGDDVNGDGACEFDPRLHDLWIDFNGNGRVDTDSTGAEPFIFVGAVRIWADLYPNGVWDNTELLRDVNGNGRYDGPASGDRRWWELECLPYWFGQRFDFDRNDFGVAVTTSAVTKSGVAYAKLTYPRQLARRLIVTVNGEANGVRDRVGERFILPVIVGQ